MKDNIIIISLEGIQCIHYDVLGVQLIISCHQGKINVPIISPEGTQCSHYDVLGGRGGGSGFN